MKEGVVRKVVVEEVGMWIWEVCQRKKNEVGCLQQRGFIASRVHLCPIGIYVDLWRA